MATARTVKDVSPHEFVTAYSAHLKRSGKVNHSTKNPLNLSILHIIGFKVRIFRSGFVLLGLSLIRFDFDLRIVFIWFTRFFLIFYIF